VITYVFSVGIKTFSFACVVSGGADGFVGQNPHTTDTCLTGAPLAVPVGVTSLPSTSYRYHTASKVCHIHASHALTGNHVFRGGTAEAPSRAQRVVRGHHTAGPPKSNPFANQNPHCCWFV